MVPPARCCLNDGVKCIRTDLLIEDLTRSERVYYLAAVKTEAAFSPIVRSTHHPSTDGRRRLNPSGHECRIASANAKHAVMRKVVRTC